MYLTRGLQSSYKRHYYNMNIRKAISRFIYPEVHYLAEGLTRKLNLQRAELNEIEEQYRGELTEKLTIQQQLREGKEETRQNSIYLYERIEALNAQKDEILAKLRGWRKSYWDARKLNQELQAGIAEANDKLDDLVAEITALKEENDRLREAGATLRNHLLQEERTSAILKEHIICQSIEDTDKQKNKNK